MNQRTRTAKWIAHSIKFRFWNWFPLSVVQCHVAVWKSLSHSISLAAYCLCSCTAIGLGLITTLVEPALRSFIVGGPLQFLVSTNLKAKRWNWSFRIWFWITVLRTSGLCISDSLVLFNYITVILEVASARDYWNLLPAILSLGT